MSSRALAAASSVLLFACASAGGGADALSVRPTASEEVYTSADSVDITIDAGAMGDLEMRVRTRAEVALVREPDGAVTRVEATYLDFTGEMTNPLGPPSVIGADDIDGALVFTVDPRGHPTVVARPALSTVAGRLANPSRFAQTFFPRLPDRAVAPGDSWTDTIRVETDEEGWKLTAVYALTYTLQGDTVVDGESLLRIGGVGDASYSAAGLTAGFQIDQTLSGDVTEEVLWHPVESAVVVRTSRADLQGDLELPGIGALGIEWREVTRTRRAPR